jgi:hypothetical protein
MTPYRPYLILIGLLAAASLALTFTTDVSDLSSPGILMELPSQVGDWHGHNVFFCQNESCLRNFVADRAPATATCPACGGLMIPTWSLAEKRMLPSGTTLLRKEYIHTRGERLSVSVVIAGSDASSIHRAQGCIEGQGLVIASERLLSVDLPGRKPLYVQKLEMKPNQRTTEGISSSSSAFFVYWFVGGPHETPSSLKRIFLTATSRLLTGQASRWAYFSIGGTSPNAAGNQDEMIQTFIRQFYPMVRTTGP